MIGNLGLGGFGESTDSFFEIVLLGVSLPLDADVGLESTESFFVSPLSRFDGGVGNGFLGETGELPDGDSSLICRRCKDSEGGGLSFSFNEEVRVGGLGGPDSNRFGLESFSPDSGLSLASLVLLGTDSDLLGLSIPSFDRFRTESGLLGLSFPSFDRFKG